MLVNDDLATILQEKGLGVSHDGGWLAIENSSYPIRAYFEATDNPELWRLDIQMAMADGRFLWESFAGTSESEDQSEAKSKAFESFSASLLGPLMVGFFNQEPDDQLTQDILEDEFQRLKVYRSKLLFKTEDGDTSFLPEDFLTTLNRRLLFNDARHDLHWLRLVVAQRGDDAMLIEAHWDNQTWHEAEEAIARLNWPPTDGFRSVRLHAVIIPEEIKDTRSQEVEQSPEEKLVEALIGLPFSDQSDETNLFDSLQRMGFETGAIQKASRMMALALGRKYLKEMDLQFPDQFWEFDDNGNCLTSGRLSEDELYLAASTIEPEHIGGTLFSLHAHKSAEVMVIESAMQENSESEGWNIAPNIFFTQEPPQEVLEQVKTQIETELAAQQKERLAREAAEAEKKKSQKPWWKIW